MILSKSSTLALILAATASNVSAQCYYAAGKLASSNYVPCGSTANGQQQSCCHLGDNCLADGVCFSLGTGMTYIAGCTDSQYQDGTCGAQQCDKNTQIQGIAMPCGTGTWYCCTGNGQRGDNPSKTSQDSCPCVQNAEPVIQDTTSFALTAILPQSANGQILLINGAGATTGSIPVPTASSSSSSTSSSSTQTSTTSDTQTTSTSGNSSPTAAATTSSQSSTNTGSSAAPTSSSSPSNSGSGNSSGGGGGPNLRLILGVTIPLIILLLAALAFFAFRFWRKRRANNDDFGPGGWDPFRHQPDDRRGSRSSAVWDNSYNAVGTYAGDHVAAPHANDDYVAQAVRQNAEENRKHYRSESGGGGLRPMSELGGFVPWKNEPAELRG